MAIDLIEVGDNWHEVIKQIGPDVTMALVTTEERITLGQLLVGAMVWDPELTLQVIGRIGENGTGKLTTIQLVDFIASAARTTPGALTVPGGRDRH